MSKQAAGSCPQASDVAGQSVTAMLASPSLTVTTGQKPSAAGWVHVDVCLCMQAMLLQCLVRGFALNFLQQLACIIVVGVHSVLQAAPMPSGASRLLNRFHETKVHES